MTINAIKARPLPNYTKTEEILNSASHIAGAFFGIFVLVSCILSSKNAAALTGSIIYGISMILLYSVSGIYHGISKKYVLAKQLLRNADHCTIYVLIAGTYSPVLLGAMYPILSQRAVAILIGVWAAAVIGMILTAVDLERFLKLSVICYVALGWFSVFIIKPVMPIIKIEGLLLLAGGGVSYTIGALLYALGKKTNLRYMHFVFHLFVILGTLLHYLCVINYCLS